MLGLLHLINQVNGRGILNYHAKKISSQHKLDVLAPPINPGSSDTISMPNAVQGFYSGPNTPMYDDFNSQMPMFAPNGDYSMQMMNQTPESFYAPPVPSSFGV